MNQIVRKETKQVQHLIQNHFKRRKLT